MSSKKFNIVCFKIDKKLLLRKNLIWLIRNIYLSTRYGYKVAVYYTLNNNLGVKYLSLKNDFIVEIIIVVRSYVLISQNLLRKFGNPEEIPNNGPTLVYSDSVYKDESQKMMYHSRPIFSPLLLNQYDYLGPVLTFLIPFESNYIPIFLRKLNIVNLNTLISLNIQNCYRVDSALYLEDV